MKKSIIFFWGLLCFALSAQAQSFDTTNFYGKMNYLYANINKAPISTGLLREYGIDFQNLDLYTGTYLHDSNFASLTDWRMLYGSIYSQQINSTAGLLYLDSLNKKFNQHISMEVPIGFVTMYYQYQSIDPNGVNNNQFYLSNHQLFDVNGRSGSPYLTKDVFAIATTRQAAYTGANQFIFSNDLFFGNTGKTISSIQVDALGNGNYQTVYMGTAFTVNYSTPGLYSVNIQITYTDNTVKYAHTKLAVHAAPANAQARFGTVFTPASEEPVTATKPYLGVLGREILPLILPKTIPLGK